MFWPGSVKPKQLQVKRNAVVEGCKSSSKVAKQKIAPKGQIRLEVEIPQQTSNTIVFLVP